MNCVPLPETLVSFRLCWLNSSLRMVMVEWVFVFFIGKISAHLEWASTTTRKLRPLIGPAKSTCIRDHGCSGYVQCKSTVRGGFFCASMQGTQLLTVFLMSESTLGQYTTLWAMDFIWLILRCPECSYLRTAFVGTTTRSTNIRHSSMTDKKSLCCLNCWRSPVRSGGHECLRNLWTFFVVESYWVSRLISILVTGIVRIQSVSVRWKSSSMLMATIMVSSSGTDCKLRRREKASAGPNFVVLRYRMSKSYPNKMIVQSCSRLAEFLFSSQILTIIVCGLSGVWSGPRITSYLSESASFSTWLLFCSDLGSAACMILFTNPSARAGYDTRSIFKRSLTGLNSEFSFS